MSDKPKSNLDKLLGAMKDKKANNPAESQSNNEIPIPDPNIPTMCDGCKVDYSKDTSTNGGMIVMTKLGDKYKGYAVCPDCITKMYKSINLPVTGTSHTEVSTIKLDRSFSGAIQNTLQRLEDHCNRTLAVQQIASILGIDLDQNQENA